jgi:hypothetical protein
MSDNSLRNYGRLAWLNAALAIAAAIGLGICCFACAPVLSDMPEGPGWSWSMTGLMNTVNSAGDLVGAFLASRAIRLVRPSYDRSAPRLIVARMQQRHLRDIGLTSIHVQSRHLHFANAEAQLGMIR